MITPLSSFTPPHVQVNEYVECFSDNTVCKTTAMGVMVVLSPGYMISVQLIQVVFLRLLSGLLLDVDGIEILHQVRDVVVVIIPSG